MFGDKELHISDSLVLRRIIPLDAEDIFHTINEQREYLGKWLPFVAFTNSIEDSELFINQTLNEAYNTDIVYTIREKQNFAGIIGYKSIDELNHKLEIGYWLSQQSQGKGIMTQCVHYLCQYAFTKLSINRIQIKCAVDNHRSSAIPKRLNFTYEGIEREGELLSEGYTNLEVYSLLKNEFHH